MHHSCVILRQLSVLLAIRTDVGRIHCINKMQQIGAIAFDPKIRLGQGGYSSVFAGTWKNQEIAVKRVESIDTEDKEEKALRQLTHSNVVKLFEIESDNAFK